ncbi:hypothetical protein M5K25_005971 [Dendrobium thyrsiflorum]|uniref:Uncharacterized protein n=1 Tax=Dendrobium thyrsiflorum TaxID=117978 RepID=A0ABD0VBQ4_DENTH
MPLRRSSLCRSVLGAQEHNFGALEGLEGNWVRASILTFVQDGTAQVLEVPNYWACSFNTFVLCFWHCLLRLDEIAQLREFLMLHACWVLSGGRIYFGEESSLCYFGFCICISVEILLLVQRFAYLCTILSAFFPYSLQCV